MAEIPLITGYSLQCWKKSLNIHVEKLVGNNMVEKLQIIHLFKANFNLNDKWIG